MEEVKAALAKMEFGKAPGSDEINLEMIAALGEEGVIWIHSVLQAV